MYDKKQDCVLLTVSSCVHMGPTVVLLNVFSRLVIWFRKLAVTLYIKVLIINKHYLIGNKDLINAYKMLQFTYSYLYSFINA